MAFIFGFCKYGKSDVLQSLCDILTVSPQIANIEYSLTLLNLCILYNTFKTNLYIEK